MVNFLLVPFLWRALLQFVGTYLFVDRLSSSAGMKLHVEQGPCSGYPSRCRVQHSAWHSVDAQ